MSNDQDFVNVAIRIKPVQKNESRCLQIISHQPSVLLLLDKSQTFIFDNVFSEETNQEAIYNGSVKNFVDYVKQGYNCTVFAYGQTGTGKTFTMGTNSNMNEKANYGLIPRALDQFFEYDNENYLDIEISLSFIEIYNEKVFDLLQNNNTRLQIKGLKAHGFIQEKVFTISEAKHILNMGNRNRHTAGTKQNLQSSRSHAIFTIYCNVKDEDKMTSAKLNLVDLAGYENVKKTGTFGSTFQEGININKGLLSIGQVMTALSNNASYIPYRQSVITSLLQDSLNKQTFVSLIACVNPLAEYATETIQTLDFAQRVKRFKSKPEVNEVILQYKKEHPQLFQMNIHTPFKKPLSICTPDIKKAKQLVIVKESNVSNNNSTNHNHSSKSFSSNVASSASAGFADFTQQGISPVIKRYMTAIEASLQERMDTLESVLSNTIKQCNPNKRPRISVEDYQTKDNFATPIKWTEIQNEVTKIIKSEIAQLTLTKKIVTSSPIGEPCGGLIKQALVFDESPVISEDASKDKKNDFKVPSIIHQRKEFNIRSTPSLSPTQNITFFPRRSVRLSMKRMSRNLTSALKGFEVTMDESSFVDQNMKNLKKTVSKENENGTKIFRESRNIKMRNEPIGDCTSRKRKALTVLDTPAGKRLTKKNTKDSPCTAHTKHVLEILNNGTTRELQQLSIVGSKTAQQINLFREINGGKFKKISDLGEMPGFSKKSFEKFIRNNLLKEELI